MEMHLAEAENEYDVIVVGAGIGGLTCGALLSKEGFRVLVLEQGHQVGGYCTSFSRKDYVFNSGPSDFSSLWEGGTLDILLKELEIEKDRFFIESKKRIVVEGKSLDIPNGLEEVILLLSKIFPEDAQSIRAFCNEGKSAYEEICSDIKAFGSPLTFNWLGHVLKEEDFAPYKKAHEHLKRWFGCTYLEIMEKYIDNVSIQKILFAFTSYTGTTMEDTPAMIGLTIFFSYFYNKSYTVKGGAGVFAELLKEVIEKNGGKVFTNTKADRITVGDGHVTGVIAQQKTYQSKIVVSNANAKHTFLELLQPEYLGIREANSLQAAKMSPSHFILYLGVSMDLSDYPEVVIDTDACLDVYIHSKKELGMAPHGCSSLTVLLIENTEYHALPERNSPEYHALKHQMAELIMERLEKIIPGVTKHSIVKEVATPRTFERYTSMPEGAWYSLDQSIHTERPFAKTSVKGLYLVGASVLPGCGIEGVATSGRLCANDIIRNTIK